jgi:hypothetical protein
MPSDITRSTYTKLRHYRAVRKQQGRLGLDADWNEQTDITAHRFDTEALDLVGRYGVPKDNAGFGLSIVNNVPVISAGRAYVDGIVCENETGALALTAQPDLPNLQLPAAASRYLAYLDVWEREITAVDDPNIREVALGGADTCTRRKTVWQVKLLAADALGGQFACGNALPAFDGLSRLGTGTLAAQAAPTQPSSGDPCVILPFAGYTGLESRLYRIEILTGGAAAAATFTWARDNASSAAAWNAQTGNVLTVAASNAVSFAGGQWIELTDDTHVLTGARGVLVRLVTVSGSTLTIDPATASAPVDIANFPLNPKVIGWHSPGGVSLAAGTWVTLENGVQVQFANAPATYRAGDYWLIPARPTSGILWPVDAANAPLAEPPNGIAHHYARVAIADFDGKTWTFIQDCRPTFPPLTELPAVSGPPDALKVEQVTLGQPFANDTTVSVNAFAPGLQVVLDRAPDPLSINAETFTVTLFVPFPFNATQTPLWGAGLAGTVPHVLDAQIQVNQTTLSWQPTQRVVQFLQNQLFQGLVQLGLFNGSLLARITLKGNVAWLQGHPGVHLDGTAFGTTTGPNAPISLKLPGGAGRSASNVEMWFFLTPGALLMTGFTLDTPVIRIGVAPPFSTGTVSLSGPAPAGGVTVSLATVVSDSTNSNIAGAVSSGPSVTIAAGASSGKFIIEPTVFTIPRTAQQAPSIRTIVVTATLGSQILTQRLTAIPAFQASS